MLDLFSTAIGTPEYLTAHCVARKVAFLRGMGAAGGKTGVGKTGGWVATGDCSPAAPTDPDVHD